MNLPIEYKGELHEIHLVNFSIDPQEVASLLPAPLKLRLFNGRAMISMVDVSLRKMRPAFLPGFLHFNYQHVAFRLLIEDHAYNRDGTEKGIYFLRSFTDNSLIVTGGKWTTDYNLENAELRNLPQGLVVRQGENIVAYNLLGPDPNPDAHAELKSVIGAIDRAYVSDNERDVYRTRIMRERWPLIPMQVQRFKNTFFKTARLEGVFKVPEVIHYRWLPQQRIKPCA